MAHYFEECMISCQDPRLNKIHFELMQKRGMIGQTDTIFWGNPIFDLVYPKNHLVEEFVLEKFEIAIINHQVKVVRLYNHFDCGYYAKRGFKFALEEKDKERERLISDMKKANQVIKEAFPDSEFKIFMYLLDEGDDGEWRDEKIK